MLRQAISAVSTPSQLDEIVGRLKAGAQRFVRLSLDERIALARSMQNGYLGIAEASVRAACEVRGLPPELAGEQIATGPVCVVRGLRLTIEALESIKLSGNTKVGKIGGTADGRLAVRVFPGSGKDGILFSGVTVDVHMAKGVDPDAMRESRARFYNQKDHDGRVALILGAGNIDSIVSCDVITKMFNEGKTCIVKINPVNAFLGPYLEKAYAEPIAQGFLAIVYGGADEGAYLVGHAGMDEVHLTGSDRTYDSIVWGSPGPERDRRKERGERLIIKPVTAELGNVAPIIVVPGRYSSKELLYQAEDAAGSLTFASSFACCTGKVVVTARGWPQREEFLDAIKEILARTLPRVAYYPGAIERFRTFTAGRPGLWTSGARAGNVLPWAFAAHLDSANRADIAFRQESFCPVLFETAVGSNDPEEFLEAAVDFANETLWGTLTATLVVPRKLQKDAELGPAVERAIARLRYGTVGVNGYPVLSFAFGAPWGGYPGATPENIQSGIGWVHNSCMLEGVEKVVMRNPITAFPKPVYFPSHRSTVRLAPRLLELEASNSWARVPAVVAAAMRC
jgi:Aldehyde dehydrogenase family